jgi:CRP-like cAMP-binding protein
VEDSFAPVSVPFGAVIVREGEPADAYYVIVSGSARAVKAGEHGEEVPLNTLGPGDGFGEVALLEETVGLGWLNQASEPVDVPSHLPAVGLARSGTGSRDVGGERRHRATDLRVVPVSFAHVAVDDLCELGSGVQACPSIGLSRSVGERAASMASSTRSSREPK